MNPVESELSGGVLPARDLRDRLGVSPATLMRTVQAMRATVLRIGLGRATRYGLRQSWPNIETTRFPVFRISDAGSAASAGELITMAARQMLWLPAGDVINGLPIELADARPSGFLARQFAAMHSDLRLPARVSDWSDHHILIAMSRRGEDLTGNMIIGDESFARWQALDDGGVTRADFPRLAEATTLGHPPGSSAGGERPKFGAFVDGRHCLVKFAARGGTGDLVARRWCDLLVLEALALDLVSSRGLPAARTAIVESDSHVFLESERFDRVGVRGRLAVLSLAAVHDEAADTWARAATLLLEAGRLSGEDSRRLRWLDAFGALIGNTDRHLYNVVFFPDGDVLRLAPAYDQASMAYAPSADGQVSFRPVTLPHATADTLDVWDDARAAACEFWQRAADDQRISPDLRVACAAHAAGTSAGARP